jgi:protein-ribulosamine 3-kinase
MVPSIDPAIIRALASSLKIDPATAFLSIHGSSGFASTFRIQTPQASVFVKQSQSAGAAVMFEGEHASLNAIHTAMPELCPQSYAWGALEGGGYFLATEFLDASGPDSKRRWSDMSLAQKMAKLHTTTAPVPEGHNTPMFGFPVTTCCGDTPQDNSFKASWADFFAENRLLMILRRIEKNNGKDADLRKVVERTATEMVPRLLGEKHLGSATGIQPVVIHGDLWSGNHNNGVIFDPSAVYGHNEYEIGIQKMFGGFGTSFYNEYHKLVPKTEPIEEYEVGEVLTLAYATFDTSQDRIALYESYHHLNHYAIFGGGYKNGATGILKKLLKKYGTD